MAVPGSLTIKTEPCEGSAPEFIEIELEGTDWRGHQVKVEVEPDESCSAAPETAMEVSQVMAASVSGVASSLAIKTEPCEDPECDDDDPHNIKIKLKEDQDNPHDIKIKSEVEQNDPHNKLEEVMSLLYTYHKVKKERVNTVDRPIKIECPTPDKRSAKARSKITPKRVRRSRLIPTSTKSVPCQLCMKYFANDRTLQQHMVVHSEEKKHSCQLCGEKYNFKPGLYRHMMLSHSGEKLFQCKKCDNRYDNHTELVQHQRVHRGEKPFSCNHCDRRFRTNSQLLTHLRGHSDDRPFPCNQCHKRFKYKSELGEHVRVHSGEKFSCNQCDKQFNRKTILNQHVKRHHTPRVPFPCRECSNGFATRYLLQKHVKAIHTHPGQNQFICDICDKNFVVKAALRTHILRHNSEKRFKCTECEKQFKSKFELRSHQLVHTGGDTIFPCNLCDKQFTRKTGLTNHIRLHSGDKPFICDDCGQRFSCKRNVLVHILRTHSSRKRFSCNECYRRFAVKSDLAKHRRKCVFNLNIITIRPLRSSLPPEGGVP